jgi:SPX domain protein involved in polyphosphate accumulation
VLAAQAHWCRRYARANAAGLRKIAKKHDKQAANDAGRRFVQVRSAAAWLPSAACQFAKLLRQNELDVLHRCRLQPAYLLMLVGMSLHARI